MDLEQLLQHRGFLKALARGLVADPLEQDELLWETMEKGVLCPPRHTALKPWLALVMRNLARSRKRARQRRLLHEHAGAQQNPSESALEVAARFELVHQLALHVRALPPDYRDVVLLRFFDGHPPREIAEQLSVPLETVKTRLRRALAMLRARLDQEHGSREKWLGSLVPFAFPGAKATAVGITTLGATIMAMKTKVALVGVAVLLLLGAGAFLIEETESQNAELGIQAKLAPQQHPEPDKELAPTPPATAPSRQPHVPLKSLTHGSVRVSVRNAADLPVPNSIVTLIEWDRELARVKKQRSARSDKQGIAVFPRIAPCLANVEAFGHSGKKAADKGQVEAGKELALTVVISSTEIVEGRVVDEKGAPAPGSLIQVRSSFIPSAFHVMATADDSGRFRFRAPKSDYLRMRAVRGDLETSIVRKVLTKNNVAQQIFKLRSPLASKVLRVRTQNGLPVVGARVIIGQPWPGSISHRSYEEARTGVIPTICAEPPVTYITDAQGLTRVNLWGQLSEHGSVTAKGMASIVEHMFFGQKGEKEIIMVPQPEVHGQVADPFSTAASSRRAIVYVTLKSQRASWVAHADKNGRYKLEGLPIGKMEIRASSNDVGRSGQRSRKSSIKMTLKAGESYLWNPVLRPPEDEEACAFLLGKSGRPLTGYYATDLSESGAVVESVRRRRSKKWGRISLPGRNRGIAIYRQGEMLPRRVIRADALRPLVGQTIQVPDGKSGSIRFSVKVPEDIRVRVNMTQERSATSLAIGLRNGQLRTQGLPPGTYTFTVVLSWSSDTIRHKKTFRSRMQLDGIHTDLNHSTLELRRDATESPTLTPQAAKAWATH